MSMIKYKIPASNFAFKTHLSTARKTTSSLATCNSSFITNSWTSPKPKKKFWVLLIAGQKQHIWSMTTKGCGSKSAYLQILAILWKYTDCFRNLHPLCILGCCLQQKLQQYNQCLINYIQTSQIFIQIFFFYDLHKGTLLILKLLWNVCEEICLKIWQDWCCQL